MCVLGVLPMCVPAAGRFPLPTTEKWGEGQEEGISKERDNSMERAPLPSPLHARASRGEGAGDFSDGGCIKMRPHPRVDSGIRPRKGGDGGGDGPSPRNFLLPSRCWGRAVPTPILNRPCCYECRSNLRQQRTPTCDGDAHLRHALSKK